MSSTIQTEEYRGVELEAAAHELTGEIFLTIDGNESSKRFPSLYHAIEYGKHKVNLKARREDPERTVSQSPYLDESWIERYYAAVGWDAEKGEFLS